MFFVTSMKSYSTRRDALGVSGDFPDFLLQCLTVIRVKNLYISKKHLNLKRLWSGICRNCKKTPKVAGEIL